MSLQVLQSMSFVKSSRFLFQLLTLPKFINDGMTGRRAGGRLGNAAVVDSGLNGKTPNDVLSYLPILCDSFEFPGQTITATDFRMPGRMKIKVPSVREINEIQATFLYPVEIPMYELFSSWIANMSTVSSKTMYYNDVLGQAQLLQYADDSAPTSGDWGSPLFKLSLIGIYPTQVTSLTANWADDGFHKISVSFFVEDFKIDSVTVKQVPARTELENAFIKGLGRKQIEFGGTKYDATPSFSSEADRYNFATNLTFKFP